MDNMDYHMSINVFGLDLGDSYSDYCLLCGSKNYLIIDTPEPDGFCCWNCQQNQWIDQLAITSYCIVHNKTEEEAEDDLRRGVFPLVLIGGQSAPDLEY